MKSADYWKRRAEATATLFHRSADLYSADLVKEYQRAIKSITKDIEAFYGRFAQNNQITMLEAKKMLDAGELREFKMTLKEFTALAKNNVDGKWTQQLNNVYYRTRISRYEALQIELMQQVELLAGKQQKGLKSLLMDTYKEAYYRNLYEIQKGTGIGVSFAKLDDNVVEKILTANWAGSNYSARIWENRDKLARELKTNLTQSFIRGDSVQKTINAIQDRFNVSRSNAARLVRTESAHIAGEATAAGYEASGIVKQYEFLATLDSRTSLICRSMDHRVFDLSEKQEGVNYPPLHANCRSTTVVYFGDEEPAERIARDQSGKVYYVPDNLSYDDWKKQYVDNAKGDIIEPSKSNNKFESIISEIPNIKPAYKKDLVERFAAGSINAQRVFTDYVESNVVADSNFKGAAHYSPRDQLINMNFAEDMKSPKGAGATFFHEFGHYVDNMAAIRKLGKATYDGVSHIDVGKIKSDDFKKAIMRDVQDYMQNYTKTKNVSLRQAQFEISLELAAGDGALHSAISDIYGGVTRKRVQGIYGHNPKYWQQLPNAIEKEAFAHMFEASFDPTGKRAELMRKYLPKAFALFQQILEAI